ncbi:hypothetical protein KHM83_04250 [Fusibacter paucivorans]|uniref:GGDEF domain-containing protein n=1 Tax=Fusibacter paucivorans TaxID=76009 RepID=A0ABS5PPB9_9FIRM|nr:hypothetical protein [Fusibacter paucivorans]MBS7525887.1 hypothetical protein [Fusibacter paucivorans]
MIHKIFRALEKTQSEALLSHLLEAAPLGVVILDDAFNYVYGNEQLKQLIHISDEPHSEKFGNLFQCSVVSQTESVCGTTRQCDNCKIRNTILSAGLLQRVVSNIKIKHSFSSQGTNVIKWFDLSVLPVNVERHQYFILMMNDQTDSMQRRIENELSGMVGKKMAGDVKLRFKEQVAALIRGRDDKAGDDVYLVSIAVGEDWQKSEGQIREMLHSFSNFVIQQLDQQMVFTHYAPEQLLLFFNDHDEARLGSFNTRLRQFCDLNYEHQCRFKHKILKIDVKPARMNPNLINDILMDEVDRWIEYIDAMTGEGVGRYMP